VPGTTAGAGVNVPQVTGNAATGNAAIRGSTASGAVAAPGINVNPSAGANAAANAAAGAGARTAFRLPTTGANANIAANNAANFRANWHNATGAQLQGVNTNLSTALKASTPAAAAAIGANTGIGANIGANAATNLGANAAANAGANAAARTGANLNAATTANINNFATLNPTRANYWSNLGTGITNTALFGSPYGLNAGYGAYGYGGVPFFGGNFWSGRNLIGLGVMSALGGGYGGYGAGGYGGLGNWWGYSPWLGNQPYGYWYGNPGWGTFANSYGWNQPFFYDYGTNGNVVYQGNQVLVNDQPVGSPEQYSQSAAELATVTPEQINAQHEWAPLGTFAVATSSEDKNPVRVAQVAYDNKQGLISGTIFNKQSGNLYTLQGKVDPQTQRIAFTIGNDPNTVMETGLYNLTQQATPVLVHFGPTKTATYVFARLPEPKEGEEAAATAAAPAQPATPPATDLRRE